MSHEPAKPVDDHNLQIFWTGYGQEYMIVQDYGTGCLMMSTYNGNVFPRLTHWLEFVGLARMTPV
jgi:hypothetical protein